MISINIPHDSLTSSSTSQPYGIHRRLYVRVWCESEYFRDLCAIDHAGYGGASGYRCQDAILMRLKNKHTILYLMKILKYSILSSGIPDSVLTVKVKLTNINNSHLHAHW